MSRLLGQAAGRRPGTGRRRPRWYGPAVRALLLDRISGPFRVGDFPTPTVPPGSDEVLLEVAFASVNPLDIWVSQGDVGAAASHLPWIPGTEATGFVEGRPVLVRGDGLGVSRPGLACEYALAPAATALPVPDDLDLALVAALGTAGVTAWNAVHTKAQVGAGDRVVVLGASGGVGTVACQLARAAGATVWGQTGSAAKAATVLGAHEVVVARTPDELQAALVDVRPTVVLDALGGGYTVAAIESLAQGGRLAVYGTSAEEHATFNVRTIYRKGLTIYGYANIVEPVARQHAVLNQLFGALRDGSLVVPHEIVPLSDAATAHQRLLDRSVPGKLVIDCRG